MENSASSFQSNYTIDIKRIYVWENGDFKGNGQVLVINSRLYRSWTAILALVTNTLKPSFGTVRNLVSLSSQEYVNGFDSLEPNGKYVALGTEKFKQTKNCYKTIKEKQYPLSSSIRASVAHCDKEICHNPTDQNRHIILFVLANGRTRGTPCKVILTDSDVGTWNMILELIAQTLQIPAGIQYLFTITGDAIKDTSTFQNGDIYVAVGANEHFINLDYLKIFQYLLPMKEIAKKQIKEINELPEQIRDPIIVNVMQNANYNMVGKSRSDGLTNINSSDRYGPICPGAKRRRADSVPVPESHYGEGERASSKVSNKTCFSVAPAKALKKGRNRARADAKQLEAPCNKEQNEKATQWSTGQSSTESSELGVIVCPNLQGSEKLHRKLDSNSESSSKKHQSPTSNLKSTNNCRKLSIHGSVNSSLLKCQNPCPGFKQKPSNTNKTVPKKNLEISTKRQPAKGIIPKKLELDKSKSKRHKTGQVAKKTTNQSLYEPITDIPSSNRHPISSEYNVQQSDSFPSQFEKHFVETPCKVSLVETAIWCCANSSKLSNKVDQETIDQRHDKSSSEIYCSTSSCQFQNAKTLRTCQRTVDTETDFQHKRLNCLNVNLGVAAYEPVPEKSTSACPIQCELRFCKSAEKNEYQRNKGKPPSRPNLKSSKAIPVRTSCCEELRCPLAEEPEKKEKRKCILSRLCSRKTKTPLSDACTEPCSQIENQNIQVLTDQLNNGFCFETCPELLRLHKLLNKQVRPVEESKIENIKDLKTCTDATCKWKHEETATNNEVITLKDLLLDCDDQRAIEKENICTLKFVWCDEDPNVAKMEPTKSKFKFCKSKPKSTEAPKLKCRKVRSNIESSSVNQPCCPNELHDDDSKIDCFSFIQSHTQKEKVDCTKLLQTEQVQIQQKLPKHSIKSSNIPSCCNIPEEIDLTACCSSEKPYKETSSEKKVAKKKQKSKSGPVKDPACCQPLKVLPVEKVICPFGSKKKKKSERKSEHTAKTAIQYRPSNRCSCLENIKNSEPVEEKDQFCTLDSCLLKEKKTEKRCVLNICSNSSLATATSCVCVGALKEPPTAAQKTERQTLDRNKGKITSTKQKDLKSSGEFKQMPKTGAISTCVKSCGSGKVKLVVLPAKSRGTDPIETLIPEYQESCTTTVPVSKILDAKNEPKCKPKGEECNNVQPRYQYPWCLKQPLTPPLDNENLILRAIGSEHFRERDLPPIDQNDLSTELKKDGSLLELSQPVSARESLLLDASSEEAHGSIIEPTDDHNETEVLFGKTLSADWSLEQSDLENQLPVTETVKPNVAISESNSLKAVSTENMEDTVIENNFQSALPTEGRHESSSEEQISAGEVSTHSLLLDCVDWVSSEKGPPCPVLMKLQEAKNLQCPFKQRSYTKQVPCPSFESPPQYHPANLIPENRKSTSNEAFLQTQKCFANDNGFKQTICPYRKSNQNVRDMSSTPKIIEKTLLEEVKNCPARPNGAQNLPIDELNRNEADFSIMCPNKRPQAKSRSKSNSFKWPTCFKQESVRGGNGAGLCKMGPQTERLCKNNKIERNIFCTKNNKINEYPKNPEEHCGNLPPKNNAGNQIMSERKEVLETPSEFIKDIIANSIVVIDRYNLKPKGLPAALGFKDAKCPDRIKQSSGARTASVCCSCPSSQENSISHENFEYRSMSVNRYDMAERTVADVKEKPENCEFEQLKEDKPTVKASPCVTTADLSSKLNFNLPSLFQDYAESIGTITPVSQSTTEDEEKKKDLDVSANITSQLQLPLDTLLQSEKRRVSIMLDGAKPMVFAYSDSDSTPDTQDMLSAAMLFEQFRSEPESNIPSFITVSNAKPQILVTTKAQCKSHEYPAKTSNELSSIVSPRTLSSDEFHLTKCFCQDKDCSCQYECFGKLLNSISETPQAAHNESEEKSIDKDQTKTSKKPELSAATVVTQLSSLSGLIVGENSSTYNGPAAMYSSAITGKFSKRLESPTLTVDPLDMFGSAKARQKTESLQTMFSTFPHVNRS